MAKRGRPRREDTAAPPAPQRSFVDVPVSRPSKPLTIAEDNVASQEWDRVCDLLTATLTPADVGILTSYCSTAAILVHARRQLHPSSQGDGKSKRLDASAGWDLLTDTAAGGTKVHGLVGVVNSSARDLARYSAELGMTPAARSRAGQAAAPTEDEFDAWERRNRGV